MPVFRKPDGNMTEKPTGWPGDDREDDTGTPAPGPTPAGRGGPGGDDHYTNETVIHRTRSAPEAAGPEQDDSTRIVGGMRSGDADGDGHRPIVGWLVVIDGPGAGRDVRLRAGRNEIGRSAEAGAPVPFGDRYMSRRQQLWISYDELSGRFTAAPGTSENVSYVNDTAVEGPTALPDGAIVRIGKTTLKFAAFCGHRSTGELHSWTDRDGDGTRALKDSGKQ